MNMLVNDYQERVESVTHITGHADGHGRIQDSYVDRGAKERAKLCKFIKFIEIVRISFRFSFFFVQHRSRPA